MFETNEVNHNTGLVFLFVLHLFVVVVHLLVVIFCNKVLTQWPVQ